MHIDEFEHYSSGVQASETVRLVMYGEAGIGLSTMMSYLSRDKTLILDAENGTRNLDVQRLSIFSAEQLYSAVKAICSQDDHFGLTTVVIDGWDSIEEMMVEDILIQHEVQVLDEVAGGFGAGKTIAAQDVRTLLALLECLAECGISVIIIGHQVNVYTEVMTATEKMSFDRISLFTVNKKTLPILMEWADAVIYAGRETTVIRNLSGIQEADTKRTLYTEGTLTYEAKNRIDLPKKLPMTVESLHLIMGQKQMKEDRESASNE